MACRGAKEETLVRSKAPDAVIRLVNVSVQDRLSREDIKRKIVAAIKESLAVADDTGNDEAAKSTGPSMMATLTVSQSQFSSSKSPAMTQETPVTTFELQCALTERGVLEL